MQLEAPVVLPSSEVSASDIAGFSVIACLRWGSSVTSESFLAMIFLSLIASLVLTTAALGILHQLTSSNSEEEE